MFSNPFDIPQKYRNIILESRVLTFRKKEFKGKSLACLFLTRFCGVGCSFCFFKSAPPWKKPSIEDQLSNEGVEKFIEFSKKANLGYLLVSGGGEPLNQKKHIFKIIESVEAERIVLVTSGNWAKNYDMAYKYIQSMYEKLLARNNPAVLVLRVSVSSYHSLNLGLGCILNIAKVFNTYFPHSEIFLLQIKGFKNDQALVDLLKALNQEIPEKTLQLESDNKILNKIIPEQFDVVLGSGCKIRVQISTVFNSSIKPDLNNLDNLKDAMAVFDADLKYAEDHNSAVVLNRDGTRGLDWSIGYNGNVCVWQNQSRDTYMNIYQDSFEKVFKTATEDPLSYSLIDKGNFYREQIINEANPRAVLRLKAMGLRDAAGVILFEEEKCRLYYSIRVIQDYIKEGKITLDYQKGWPEELKSIVNISKNDLVRMYKSSNYSVVDQQLKKKFVKRG